jgi:two-component system nitrate/nitrite sensor histidine kinase NarX
METGAEERTDTRSPLPRALPALFSRRSRASSIQDYLTLFAEQTGLRTEMRVEGVGEPDIPPLAQVQLLRVVQEALTNVRKHARATQATIVVRVQDQVIEIVVEDDGQGFDLAQVLQERGPRFGLQTMRERAEEVGGTFQVDTAPGRGTRVRVQLSRR